MATQTPPDLAALLALAVVGAAAARRVEVQVKEGWREPTNIYVLAGLASGSRKSAVYRDVTAPLNAEEERLGCAADIEIALAAEKKLNLESALAAERKKVEKGNGDPTEVRRLVVEIAQHRSPARPRLIADDVTAEKLEELLAQQGGRLAVFAPEADVFDIMAGRYSKSGVVNLGVFLKAHPGDDLRVDRMTRSVVVHRPSLTLGLTVQPEVIESLADRKEFRGRGLTPRFLFALPVSNIGRRDVNPPPVPPLVRSTYEARMSSLLSIREQSEEPDYRPHVLHLTAKATQLLDEFAAEVEDALNPGGLLHDVVEWGSKLVGAVARIAGLLYLADDVGRVNQWRVPPITHDEVQRAIQIGRYLIPHAKAAFALMGADPALADARHILTVIEAKKLQVFTVRQLFELVKGRFKKVGNLKEGLGVLADHGFIRARPEPERIGPGRKPSPTVDVNPWVLSQNSQNSHKHA